MKTRSLGLRNCPFLWHCVLSLVFVFPRLLVYRVMVKEMAGIFPDVLIWTLEMDFLLRNDCYLAK